VTDVRGHVHVRRIAGGELRRVGIRARHLAPRVPVGQGVSREVSASSCFLDQGTSVFNHPLHPSR
jgi:hypothetical protein